MFAIFLIFIGIIIAILRLWNRLIGMPNDRVTKKIFNWDFENDRNGWCGDVKTILSLLDMSDVYQNQQPCNLNLALSKLESICQLQWKQTLDLKPRLRTYQTFKEDYATEEYLNIFLTRYQLQGRKSNDKIVSDNNGFIFHFY